MMASNTVPTPMPRVLTMTAPNPQYSYTASADANQSMITKMGVAIRKATCATRRVRRKTAKGAKMKIPASVIHVKALGNQSAAVATAMATLVGSTGNDALKVRNLALEDGNFLWRHIDTVTGDGRIGFQCVQKPAQTGQLVGGGERHLMILSEDREERKI